VVLRKDAKATEAELADFCRSRLASFKRPEKIQFIDALPKNQLGKILRKDLRAQ
jgi:acyl-coenzyme A synthetase/AMP-(fatty) acid ligase